MTGQCCLGGGQSSRLARRLSGAASILPGVLLVLLPKCPLCLAAWLTVATGGLAVSAAVAGEVRWGIAVFWLAAVSFAVAQIIRRRER